MEFHVTHHHTLKLSIELLELGWEFLPGKKTEDFTAVLSNRGKHLRFNKDLEADQRMFTSHV